MNVKRLSVRESVLLRVPLSILSCLGLIESSARVGWWILDVTLLCCAVVCRKTSPLYSRADRFS